MKEYTNSKSAVHNRILEIPAATHLRTADLGGTVVLDKILGDGGFATVYQGAYSYKNSKDEKFTDPVAVKIAHTSVQIINKFQDEIAIMQDLYSRGVKVPKLITWSYPNEHGVVAGIIMELLNPQTYDDTKFELTDLMPRIAGIGKTLDEIHKSGYLHLDIKPKNISIHDGHRILDFGLARDLRAESTRTAPDSMLMGTEPYMAPEQTFLDVRLTPRADQYQWSRCVKEMLEFSSPSYTYRRHSNYDNLSRSDTKIAARIRNREFTPLQIDAQGFYPSFTDDLNTILEKSQRKYPDDRYHNIAAMMHDFNQIVQRISEQNPEVQAKAG